MLSWVEKRAALPDNNVARNHVLVCCVEYAWTAKEKWNVPENFLTPKRLPGDPP